MSRYLFVDYENIRDIDGVASFEDLEVWMFVGPHQKNLPIEDVRSLLPFGERTRIIEIAKAGKNSLDFHICFELGRLTCDKMKPARIYVLSRDKGFDSVVAFSNSNGLVVERIGSVSKISKATKSANPTKLEGDVILEALGNMAAKQRPRKLTTFRSYFLNRFKRSIEPEQLEERVDALIATGVLYEENGTLKYNLPS